MVPKKGQEIFKEKQLTKEVPAKQPAIAVSESEEEGKTEDQQAILEQLAALSWSQGLFPGGLLDSTPPPWGRQTWKTAQKRFELQVHNHLSFFAFTIIFCDIHDDKLYLAPSLQTLF